MEKELLQTRGFDPVTRQRPRVAANGMAVAGFRHGRALVVDRLVNRRLTRALAADIRSYEPGDIVVFHRDVFGCLANDVLHGDGPQGRQGGSRAGSCCP